MKDIGKIGFVSKKIQLLCGFLACYILLFSSCSEKNKTKELTVFCAASLTDVVSELTTEFEQKSAIQIRLNTASSGTLARQIEHGAEPAIFISANKRWIDYLNKLELTIPETEKKVAGNALVLIAPVNSSLNSVAFSPGLNLPGMFEGRLSIGDPQHVPAGIYAVQTLESMGIKDELAPRFLPAKDVRSALMVVELGAAEAGIVYKTDALKSKKVKIITEFPDSLHKPVNYYIVMLKGQKNKNSVDLYNYMVSENVNSVWEKYGFKI